MPGSSSSISGVTITVEDLPVAGDHLLVFPHPVGEGEGHGLQRPSEVEAGSYDASICATTAYSSLGSPASICLIKAVCSSTTTS